MTDAERAEAQLVAASRGDADAFAAFYRAHAETVVSFFAARVRDPEAAADLMAETFAALLLSVKRYKPGGDVSAIALLFKIAHSKLIDSHRRGEVSSRARLRLGLERLELTDHDLERVTQLAHSEEAHTHVLRMVADLPMHQREALLARVVEERGYGEIARHASCSEAVVRKRVSRALATLRTRLAGERR